MQAETIGSTTLSPLNGGSCFSYKLCGNTIVVRFLGLVPVTRIGLADLTVLRLATRSETSPVIFWLNQMRFYLFRRMFQPIYLLQTRTGRRYFIKLDKAAHRRLSKAVQHVRQSSRRILKAA